MRIPFFLGLSALPLCGQLLVPETRGEEGSSFAKWDRFTEASFLPNPPDVVFDEDASITSTTGSAFITSSGNLYSFQAPIALQLDDSTDLQVRSLFLQLVTLGSGVDLEGARLVYEDHEGVTRSVAATRTFVASEEELTGERGGIGTTYGLQWDLREMPLSGRYALLFQARSTSLSIDQVSLDLAERFELITKPRPLSVRVEGDEVTVSWLGRRQLQSSESPGSGWMTVPGSESVSEMTFPVGPRARFFRVVSPEVVGP